MATPRQPVRKKPLLGDRIEANLKKIRADKAARLIKRATGKDCGCKNRKEKINQTHREYLRKKAKAKAAKQNGA